MKLLVLHREDLRTTHHSCNYMDAVCITHLFEYAYSLLCLVAAKPAVYHVHLAGLVL
ncbi:hypothetical protein M404DRAFT_999093 [Pisolithus tinctorius Marx 270]|uniref:Uncharacterized protein n=1 Tax=Pisolithus tinctorius Marx 270 TaxID=870435 RepID=A0A0C3P006_PISTI|nr:hypothetical protein M404DRAFT_999093 [Pisolithus tinctorius Marx 270]